MGAKVLPDSEVEQLLRQGKTDEQVVEYLAKHHHISITRSAVGMWRKRRGIPRVIPRYDDLIPWQVKVEHAGMYIPRMLRLEARQRRGKELQLKDRQRVEAFKRKLDDQDAVVHYDPDTEQGWWFVRRRPGIDTDIIRRPDQPPSRARARD